MSDQYSAFRIISMALDGFYKAYLQLHLPACLENDLREETKKMCMELYLIAPDETRGIISECIHKHGSNKGDSFINKKILESEQWLNGVIESRRMVKAQLTETIDEHYSKSDNQTRGI